MSISSCAGFAIHQRNEMGFSITRSEPNQEIAPFVVRTQMAIRHRPSSTLPMYSLGHFHRRFMVIRLRIVDTSVSTRQRSTSGRQFVWDGRMCHVVYV